jgi:endonuclease VIII
MEFDAAALRACWRADEEIADVLLHQEVMAGVGNVFKSEICFVNGLNPFRKVATLTRDEGRGRDCQRAKAACGQCA